MKVTAEILQKIKDSMSIIEIVGEHVVLRKTGANHVGLCPFHSERTPSFSVSETKQLYHCYGCKKGGDLISFVMEILGLSFPEAIEELADRARIALPQNWAGTPPDSEQEKKRTAFREKISLAYRLNRFAASYFHQTLNQFIPASQYFASRGIPNELNRLFYLGAATESWDALTHHLIQKKAPVPLAQELGLIRPSTKAGPGYFDLFRSRAVFPILTLSGKIGGFGGRTLTEETPKYLNSSESLVFHKSKLLYGLFQAQKHIREKEEVILVEGYFDVLALYAAGIKNVVATCGTSLTHEHLDILKKLASKVIVLFDGDQAGIQATERAMETGLEKGWVLYGAQLPSGMDPDEMVFDPATKTLKKEGKEQLLEILTAAQPLLDTRIRQAVQSSRQSPEMRVQAIKQLGGWLSRFQDPIGLEVRIQNVIQGLGVPKKLILDAMGKNPIQQKPEPAPPKKPPPVENLTHNDRILFIGILTGGEYLKALELFQNQFPSKAQLIDLFVDPSLKDFVTSLLNQPGLIDQLRRSPENMMFTHLDSRIRSVLTEALLATEPLITLSQFRVTLSKGLSRLWAQFSQKIKMDLVNAEANRETGIQTQLMKEYLDVQRKMKELNNFYDEE